jgi:CRP-like cAMP-binding protein
VSVRAQCFEIKMSKSSNPILQRFLKSHTKFPYAVHEILQVKPPPSKSWKSYAPHRKPKFIKGVAHDGNYYRLRIPPRKRSLPSVPKFPLPVGASKPLSPPPIPPETTADIAGYKKRLYEWFKDNIPVLILNFGSLCTLVAFTRTDVLQLRSLAIAGNFCFVMYTLKQRIILWPSIMWSMTFASVNAWKIGKILEERNASVHMTDQQEQVFVEYFMPHGVTPKQFERVQKRAKVFGLKAGEFLIKKGQHLDHVYLIIEGSTLAHIFGRRLTAASTARDTKGDQKEGGDSGAWAGEMAFLNSFWEKEQGKVARTEGMHQANALPAVSSSKGASNPTLATAFYSVQAAEDCTVMSWSHKDMEELMESSTDLRAALTRAMSAALVGKVVNLTVSRSYSNKAPWAVWLSDWKNKDGASVEVRKTLHLAEDRG